MNLCRHNSTHRTYTVLKRLYYWKGLNHSIEKHIEHQIELAVQEGKDGWRRETWGSAQPGPSTSGKSNRNWEDLRDWTVDFACKNRFTALSTLRRWRYTDMMDNRWVSPSKWRLVRKALASQRRSGSQCLGLASIPERLWESFRLDWD